MFDLSLVGDIAQISINGRGRRNSVRIADWCNLENAVKAANASSAKLIVIRSSDPVDFCGGSDLTELLLLADNPGLRKKFRGAMQSAFDRLRNANKPTICLIAGGCFGTGVSLATACDIRICTKDARFSITPARFGIAYPKSDLDDLVSLVGRGHAARLVYGSVPIDGLEAFQIGLAEILDEGGSGQEFIDRVSQNASSSLCILKASLLDRFGVNERFDSAFASPDFARGMDAFQKKKVSRPGIR